MSKGSVENFHKVFSFGPFSIIKNCEMVMGSDFILMDMYQIGFHMPFSKDFFLIQYQKHRGLR